MAALPFGKTMHGYPQFMPQPEQQQFSSSVADLKRDEELSKLKDLVIKLSAEVNRLECMINTGVVMSGSPIRFSVVDVEDRSLSETKELLIGFYQAHGDKAIYPDDVATELGLDLKLTMQAVRDLIREGKIGEVT